MPTGDSTKLATNPLDGWKKILAGGAGGGLLIPGLHEAGMPIEVLAMTTAITVTYILAQGGIDMVKSWATKGKK